MNPQHKKIAKAIDKFVKYHFEFKSDHPIMTIHKSDFFDMLDKIADIYEEEDRKERTRYLRTFGRNQKESLRFNRTQFLKIVGAKP